MKIYVMGNLLVEQDALPIKLLPLLKKEMPEIEFVELDPSEDIVPENKELIIIDTIINAKDVCLVEEVDKIMLNNVCSLHDFDLGYNLKLMKKFGMVDKVKIIGVPPGFDEKETIKSIKEIIHNLI